MQGVLLLWHMVGQGPAVLAAGAGWVVYVFFIFVYCRETAGHSEILLSQPL